MFVLVIRLCALFCFCLFARVCVHVCVYVCVTSCALPHVYVGCIKECVFVCICVCIRASMCVYVLQQAYIKILSIYTAGVYDPCVCVCACVRVRVTLTMKKPHGRGGCRSGRGRRRRKLYVNVDVNFNVELTAMRLASDVVPPPLACAPGFRRRRRGSRGDSVVGCDGRCC